MTRRHIHIPDDDVDIYKAAYLATKGHTQEEIGHLLDLEPLWYGRIEDFVNREKELRSADLENRKTHEANHNAKPVEELLVEFRKERKKLVDIIMQMNDADLINTVLHPRLKTPMKVIDLAYFVAEHDDHHLAQITYTNCGL